ncbi:MAG: hypothetical protein ACHREM_02680 [Polyangiales bacterium]
MLASSVDAQAPEVSADGGAPLESVACTRAEPSALCVADPKGRIEASLTPDGQVELTTPFFPTPTHALSVAGISRGSTAPALSLFVPPKLSVASAQIRADFSDGSRLALQTGRGRVGGVEEIITVATRPAPDDAGQLHIDFTTAAAPGVSPSRDGRGALLRSDDGKVAFQVGGLHVTDAHGVELQSSFSRAIVAGRYVLRISIDDSAAIYPLTVDPVLAEAVVFLDPGPTWTASFPPRFSDISVSGDSMILMNASSFQAAIDVRRIDGIWQQFDIITAPPPDPDAGFTTSSQFAGAVVSGDLMVLAQSGQPFSSTAPCGDLLTYGRADANSAWTLSDEFTDPAFCPGSSTLSGVGGNGVNGGGIALLGSTAAVAVSGSLSGSVWYSAVMLARGASGWSVTQSIPSATNTITAFTGSAIAMRATTTSDNLYALGPTGVWSQMDTSSLDTTWFAWSPASSGPLVMTGYASGTVIPRYYRQVTTDGVSATAGTRFIAGGVYNSGYAPNDGFMSFDGTTLVKLDSGSGEPFGAYRVFTVSPTGATFITLEDSFVSTTVAANHNVVVAGQFFFDMAGPNVLMVYPVDPTVVGKCADGTECPNGLCVDGFCCNSPCTQECEACDVVGHEGVCSAVAGAPHNGRVPCPGGGSTCEDFSACDGTTRSKCVAYNPGAACDCTDCSGATSTACVCTASGSCSPCGAFACSSTGTCATTCTTNSQCSPRYTCNAASGTCTPPAPGSPCTTASECLGATTFCVDGVCCDSACNSGCSTCVAPGNVGSCTALAAGSTPTTCALYPIAVCNPYCDGVSQECIIPGPETPCPRPACSDACTANVSLNVCIGGCAPVTEQSCGAFACGSSGCATSCASDADCCGFAYCATGGTCLPRQTVGTACAIADQCQTQFCVDGYCCATACADSCGSCDVPGSRGFCTPIVGAPENGRPDCPGDGTSCTGLCAGTVTTCAIPPTSVACTTAMCSGDTLLGVATCDGAGSCGAPPPSSCAPFACEGGKCVSACAIAADCAPGFTCDAFGKCVAPVADAGPDVGPDAGSDALADAPGDSFGDGGLDAGSDVGTDTSFDGAIDTSPEVLGDAVSEVPLSTFCGDGIRDPILEECDEGAAGTAACSATCRTIDVLSVPLPATGTLASSSVTGGGGAHTVAASDVNIATTIVEPDLIPVSVSVALWRGDGSALTTSFTLAVDGATIQGANPSIAFSSTERLFAVWTDDSIGSSSDPTAHVGDGDGLGVAARWFDATAGTYSAIKRVNLTTPGAQQHGDLAVSGTTVLVGWEDDSNVATAPDLRVRFFDTSLKGTSSEIVLAGTDASEADLRLGSNGAHTLAVWRSDLAGVESIVAQVDTAPTGLTKPCCVVAVTSPGPKGVLPAIAPLDDQTWLVVYVVGALPGDAGTSYVTSLGYAVLDASGVLGSGELPVDEAAGSHNPTAPSLVRAGVETYVVWQDHGLDDDVWIERLGWTPGTSTVLPVAPALPIPRKAIHQADDQRAPGVAWLTALSGNAPGALGLLWDDLGRGFGVSEPAPSAVMQVWPLSLVRLATE